MLTPASLAAGLERETLPAFSKLTAEVEKDPPSAESTKVFSYDVFRLQNINLTYIDLMIFQTQLHAEHCNLKTRIDFKFR